MTSKERKMLPRVVSTSAAVLMASTALTAFSMSATAQEELALEEVVVTGSRIVRRDFTAPSPIVTIDQEAFERSSTVGVESVLNQLPQFVPGGAGGPGAGTQFGTGDVQASAFNTPGISTVNLRGIGPNRTLVLLNGRRAQPSNAALTVDVNTIPSTMIENVEVITGGASAVYGADAVAGVVNFKLRDDFDGFLFDAQTGITQEGDGEETRIGGVFGSTSSDGRFKSVFAGEWAKRNSVASADREFFRDIWADPRATGTEFWISQPGFEPLAGNVPSQAALDSIFSGQAPGTVSPFAGVFHVNPDGTIFSETGGYRWAGNPSTTNFDYPHPDLLQKQLENGNIGQNATYSLVSSPLERYSMFGRGSYEVVDNIEFFVQGNFTQVEVDQILQFSPAVTLWNASIPRDGRALPAELEALLDSRGDADADWGLRYLLDFAGPRRSSNTTTVYQMMAGFEGDIADTGWTFEAYASHGATKVKNENRGFASVNRWRDIVTAPNFGEGYVGTAAGGFSISCTSGIPVFDDFEVSQDCIDSISLNMTNTTELTQDIVEANVQGGLFDLPAGEVRAALGASYRENAVEFRPDPFMDATSVIDQPIGIFAANSTEGKTTVKEVYGEALVPVLADVPAVQSLDLELGARYSDYNTAGGVWTFKALGNWAVNEFISIRGGHQLANRAPNTAELFNGPTQTVVGLGFGDPCGSNTLAEWGNVAGNADRAQVQALCSALIDNPTSTFDQDPDGFLAGQGLFPLDIEVREGNPDVQEETVRTWTIGAVFASPFSGALSNMTATFDYYRIKVEDAIGPLSSTTAYMQCFNSNGTSNPTYDPTNSFCQTIVRDPASGGRQQVQALYFNLGTIKTSGIDGTVNWMSSLEDMGIGVDGSINLNVQFNILFEYETVNAPGGDPIENKGTLAEGGQYDYRVVTSLGYNNDTWGGGLRWRHLPSIENAAVATTPNSPLLGAGSYNIFDLYGNVMVSEAVGLRFGIDNLFDKQPPRVGDNTATGQIGTGTSPGFYDTLGRRFYAGANLRF